MALSSLGACYHILNINWAYRVALTVLLHLMCLNAELLVNLLADPYTFWVGWECYSVPVLNLLLFMIFMWAQLQLFEGCRLVLKLSLLGEIQEYCVFSRAFLHVMSLQPLRILHFLVSHFCFRCSYPLS